MKPEIFKEYIEEIKKHNFSTKALIEKLVATGMSRYEARSEIFINLGGGDVKVTDKDGVVRYMNSGVSVEEVRRLMEL